VRLVTALSLTRGCPESYRMPEPDAEPHAEPHAEPDAEPGWNLRVKVLMRRCPRLSQADTALNSLISRMCVTVTR